MAVYPRYRRLVPYGTSCLRPDIKTVRWQFTLVTGDWFLSELPVYALILRRSDGSLPSYRRNRFSSFSPHAGGLMAVYPRTGGTDLAVFLLIPED